MSERPRLPGRSLLNEIIAASPVVLFALHRENGRLTPVWMCPNVRRILDHPVVTAEDPGWWFDAVHPDDLERVENTRERVRRDGLQRFEFRLRDGSGHYRRIREELRVPAAEESEDVDAVGSWSDITALRKLEGRVRQAGRMEATARFARGVAHEFNNLLTVILGDLDLLRSRDRVEPASSQELAEIESAAKEAQWIVSQLISYTDTQRPADIEPVDPSGEIRRARAMLRGLLIDDIDLEISTDPSAPGVAMEPDHIRKILVSLVRNAQDAIAESGAIHVRTRSTTIGVEDADFPDLMPGAYAVVEVEDTGHGMDADTRQRIIDPFFTTRDRDDRTGLGLSSVYGLVTQAGGKVEIESEPDEGTRVSVYLPAAGGDA